MDDRYIKWGQVSRDRWVGYDQWNEKWEVDGWSLKKGAMITKTVGNRIEITEYFGDIETAKLLAELINEKRGNWNDR